MKFPRAWVRFAVACSILAFSPVLLPALATAGESSSNSGRLLFWLLGVHMTRQEERFAKIDVNSATVEELATVPGSTGVTPCGLPRNVRTPSSRTLGVPAFRRMSSSD
jgi:hypothetical protein